MAGAVAAAGALFLPWFEFGHGNFLILFGALERVGGGDLRITAWQAFGWQDLALVACSMVIVGAALARNAIVGVAAAVAGVVLTLTMIGSGPPVNEDLGSLGVQSPFTHTNSVWLAVAGFVVAAAALTVASRADAPT